MPVQWHQILSYGEAHEIPVFLCEVCGQPANFGHGVHLKSIKSKTDPKLGQWYCRTHNPDQQ